MAYSPLTEWEIVRISLSLGSSQHLDQSPNFIGQSVYRSLANNY